MIKAVILAGGYGTRLSEENSVQPLPMIEIGQKISGTFIEFNISKLTNV